MGDHVINGSAESTRAGALLCIIAALWQIDRGPKVEISLYDILRQVLSSGDISFKTI